MPALVFGPALFSGLPKFPLVGTSLAVLGREEDGCVLAEDLPFPVAEDALGPLVPSAHAPFGIRHKDGVVLGGLRQALEALLALLERLLQVPLSGPFVVRTTHAASSLPHMDFASRKYGLFTPRREERFCELPLET